MILLENFLANAAAADNRSAAFNQPLLNETGLCAAQMPVPHDSAIRAAAELSYRRTNMEQ